jgi:hypothetical protein
MEQQVAQPANSERFRFERRVSADGMPAHDWQAAEALLAKLVAGAYAADHPELFPGGQHSDGPDSPAGSLPEKEPCP